MCNSCDLGALQETRHSFDNFFERKAKKTGTLLVNSWHSFVSLRLVFFSPFALNSQDAIKSTLAKMHFKIPEVRTSSPTSKGLFYTSICIQGCCIRSHIWLVWRSYMVHNGSFQEFHICKPYQKLVKWVRFSFYIILPWFDEFFLIVGYIWKFVKNSTV